MKVNPDLPLESLTVDLSHCQPAAVRGRANCTVFGFRIDVKARFRNDLNQTPTCRYAQEVRTIFTKKRNGIAFEHNDTRLHDDRYTAADGVWQDGTLWVNDEPGIEVAVDETLEYSFYHRQTIRHTNTGFILAQTAGHTVYMRGTYPHIVITPVPGRVFTWLRPPVNLGAQEFRLDVDF